MHDSPIKIRDLIIVSLLSLIVVFILFFSSLLDNRTKIVFCDVGQGDAAYIRIKNKFDVLIDAGPDRKILDCLGRHMPFYDRKIELAIISHPQKDHAYGFIPVLERYSIVSVISFIPNSPTSTFNKLLVLIKDKKIKLLNPLSVKSISIAGDQLFLLNNRNTINNSVNSSSLILVFQEKGFRALFTGDATSTVLNRLVGNAYMRSLHKIDILKIPHHGSKTGLSPIFLHLANPHMAVISVGKNNSYGHPSKEVLDKLKALKIKTLRTDEKGDIVFKITNNK